MQTTLAPSDVELRWMILADHSAVLEIGKRVGVRKWDDAEKLKRDLAKREAFAMVADYKGETAGFYIYEQGQEKAYLVRLAVDPWHQREGVGRMLLNNLRTRLENKKRKRDLSATVREHNVCGQLFLKAMGFAWDSTRHAMFSNPIEDGYVMRLRIATQHREAN